MTIFQELRSRNEDTVKLFISELVDELKKSQYLYLFPTISIKLALYEIFDLED